MRSSPEPRWRVGRLLTEPPGGPFSEVFNNCSCSKLPSFFLRNVSRLLQFDFYSPSSPAKALLTSDSHNWDFSLNFGKHLEAVRDATPAASHLSVPHPRGWWSWRRVWGSRELSSPRLTDFSWLPCPDFEGDVAFCVQPRMPVF